MLQWLWYAAFVCLQLTGRQKAEALGGQEEVSFYGESYIHNPVQDASNTTSISLEFRTHQPQSLLLLASGDIDYIIIQLNAGTVETRLNLGSGEAVAFSARGVRLDDSLWHSIVVNHTVDTLYLAVDGTVQGQATTPGSYHDLNIDLGIYLGGSGNLKQNLYKNMKSFRGCLRNVSYNGRNVLEEVRAMRNAQYSFQVSWHCDAEFTAPSDSPLSFRHDTSFVAFHNLRVNSDSSGVFSCQLKTRSPNAIVLFSSGTGTAWKDFIAVELVEGKPKMSINKGSGIVEVALESAINDGRWHKLEVTVSESVVVLEIDSEKNMTRFHLGTQNTLNLGNHLFIGGVGVKARPSAIQLGLASLQGEYAMRGSMLGCIRDIQMNSRSYGFHQIQMSRLIRPECTWEYPCAQDPCISGAQCTELEGSDFRCDCGQQVCVKEQFKSQQFGQVYGDISGILSVGKLEVVEGGSSIIDSHAVNIRHDLFRDGLREENILFTIKEAPKMGVVEIGGRRGNQQKFTARDLISGNVYYRHYGGESVLDSITLEMSLSSQNSEPESKQRDRYDFVVPVTIFPQTTTKLEIVLRSGNVLPITADAKVRITTSVLDVKTVSIDPATLVFVIMYLRQANSMFERSNAPRKSVTSFTLQEVQDGGIWFQHRGDKTVYTRVNVTNGVLLSDAVDLRFREENLSISVINNTGLSVSYGLESVITSSNLSSAPNVKLEDLELRYQITQPPAHGTIQFQEHKSLEWTTVETFTQRHIDGGRLRYQHLPGATISSYDSIQFEVLTKDVKTNVNTFKIIFKTVTLTVERNDNLILYQVPFGKFSEKILLVESSADKINLKNIVYSVLRAPHKGSLYHIKRNINNINYFDQIPSLKVDDSFTQQDIYDGHIYYKLDKPAFDKVDDFTDLQASYFGFTVMVRSVIQYLPEKTPVRFINNGLKDVLEGGQGVISSQELSLETDTVKEFTFSILRSPAHGCINIIDPSSSATIRHNVSSFTMREIKERKVVYKHDDSESKEDSFMFTAVPELDVSVEQFGQIREYSDTFHVHMKMRNDNPPVRAFTKVFQVAEGQVKHLTISDLAFVDPDIDFDDSLLIYQRQPISNGEIISTATEEAVYNFTQADLMNRALMFQHSGDSYARGSILVTDGQFFSSSLFEVQASPPFIRVNNNTGVEVKQSKYTTITNENLSIETNLDFKPDEVIFQVVEAPKYGHIRARGQQTSQFYFLDLINGQVRYWHAGGDAFEDKLVVAIHVGSVKTQAEFFIRIMADGASDPPEIIHNRILRVAALQSEVISSNILQVSHRSYRPDEIEYIITQLPKYGHLIIKGRSMRQGSAPEFTQQDINDGHITYKSDSMEHLSDTFLFDVGTDIQSLRHIEFLIEIIPPVQQINQVNIMVMEDGNVALTDRNLHFRGRVLQNKMMFHVQSPPVHGKIMVKRDKRVVQVSSFSSEDLIQGHVTYTHDGSESLYDEVTLRDNDTGQLYHIIINVTAVNDQPPIVTINSGLDIWSGSLTLLTKQHLHASDPDSSSEEIQFHVTDPTNGHLAYLNNTFKQISKFTQMDLDSGRVVFVHKGNEAGDFKFQATDGINKDESHVFKIRAHPVQITVSVNKPVKAFPNILQPVTNTTLLAVTSAPNFTHPIVFTIVEPRPKKGKLVTVLQNRPVEINSFTQSEINEGKVFFQHTSSVRNWMETETVYFEITTTYAQALTGLALVIDISFANINEENYRKLLNINVPSLEEGDKVTLTRAYFDSTELVRKIQSFKSEAKVVFSFSSTAKHGYLWFKDKSVDIDEEFTQDDLTNGALVYKHDHSETLEDSFQFAVKLLVPRTQSEASTSVAKVFNFTIVVNPLNDCGFELINRHPKIKVLQGQEVVVTAHNLTTVDLDTGPEGIEYRIITQPKNGMLVRLPNTRTRIQSFTQKDINDGIIVFKHDGSKEGSGSLYFQVWDGKFEPWPATMEITGIPITIQVDRDRSIPLIQGQNFVALSNRYLKVSTNGDINALTYKVTQAPQFGKLMKHTARVQEFSQADINGGQLLYIQDDDSPGDDFFVCNIEHNTLDCSLKTVQFELIMKPRIRQGPLTASSGSHVAITRSSLDASELAQITNDNPQFTITDPPHHGRIMRRHRQRRQVVLENTFHPVSNFTFEDIVYTKIYYVPNSQDKNIRADKFTYLLKARGVPQAKGEFLIQLDTSDTDVGHEKDRETTDTGKPDKDSSSPNGYIPDEAGKVKEDGIVSSSVESSNNDDNNIVIIATVVAVLIIIVIIVVLVIVFVRRRSRNQASVQEVKPVKPRPYISGPLQLEQPHVQIQPKEEALGSPVSADDTALVPRYTEEDQWHSSAHMETSLEAESLLPVIQKTTSSLSPDVTRVEYSNTPYSYKASVPPPDTVSDQISEDTDHRSTMTSGRGSDASADLLDWTLMDPDLLQQCRVTTPVLRNNQYWL